MRASTALETNRPIHAKIWKSHSNNILIWKKAFFYIEDKSIHFYKALWKDEPVPFQNQHVQLHVSKLFSNILEGLCSPVHVYEEHKGHKYCAMPAYPQEL